MSKVFKSFMSMVITAILLANLTAIASAETPPGYKHESKTVEYSCNAQVGSTNIPIQMFANIEADVPLSVQSEQSFTVKNSFATITLPSLYVTTLRLILGWTSFEGNVSLFEVNADNPNQTVNVAASPISIPVTSVPLFGDLNFVVPSTGGIDVDFYAGSPGNINLSAGNISATFVKGSSSGGLVDTLTVNCQPRQSGDTILTTIPVN